MCGLVGIVTKLGNGFNKDQVDAFNDLLYLDSLRGMDSTGVFLVENNGTLSWNKEAVASPDFCRKKEHQDMLQQAFRTGRALVGHNRAATRGVVNDENAHPFTVDDRITLVHNGTLYGDHRKLADVEVDSHAIAHVIHENGDDVEKAIQQINGAFALIWHDYEKKTLNFLRNSARPLHWVETPTCWIWASEANMIEWILARYSNLRGNSAVTVAPLTPGMLTTYAFENYSWKVDSKEIKMDAPKPTYVPTTSHGGGRGRYWPDYDDEDVNQLANGYCGFDLNPNYTDTKDAVPFVPKQTSTNVVRLGHNQPAVNSPRVINEEMKVARDLTINMSGPTFAATDNVVKVDEWVSVECKDYITIAKDTAASGYFIYGVLVKDPRFMVRVYVEPTVDEMTVLDLTLNAKVVLAKVASRSWRAFYNAADGQGYGLIACSRYNEVVEMETGE